MSMNIGLCKGEKSAVLFDWVEPRIYCLSDFFLTSFPTYQVLSS